jgi:sigma-B regulation protein RsbU (phosphoserine phosphatase)
MSDTPLPPADPPRPADADRRLATREQELRTLLELAQAFGRDLEPGAILGRLGYALMGQLLVRRVAAFLRGPDGRLESVARTGAGALPDVPDALADAAGPTVLAAGPLAEAGFAVAIPLRAGDVSRGVVLIGARAGGGPPDPDAFHFAAALAALAVGAIETADRVADRVAARVAAEQAAEEMRVARDIQRGLLPRALPAVPGLDLAVRWRPSHAVSGDTYDVAALTGGRLVVAVGDVVGKGLPAALLTSTLQAGLRLLRPSGLDAGAALAAATTRLDRLVAEVTEPHQFATLAWAVVDPRAGRVWSVAAGHPAPRVVRAGGHVDALDAGGPLLGVLPGATFTFAEAAFEPGDTLVLFTDGLTETARPDGEEWGEEGLDAALVPGLGAGALLDHLVAASDAFAGTFAEGRRDDLTAVAVRYDGPA